MKKLTIKEIAKIAGVSVTAVSFALNDKPGISETTRKKVRDIIEETGFVPNLTSRKLLLKKSFNISLVINEISSPFDDLFYFEVMKGILKRSTEYGYNLVIKKFSKENLLPDIFYSGDIDGLIFMQDISPEARAEAANAGIPFVIIDSHSNDPSIVSVQVDYAHATYKATKHLIECGHKDIAMISSDKVPKFYEQTLLGFNKALTENNLALRTDLADLRAQNEETASLVAEKIFSAKKRPTAILCTIDSFAFGAMQCAKKFDLSIPKDISLIGIDDILISRYIEPRLTTIEINKTQMGIIATDLLYDMILGKKAKSVIVPSKLLRRDTVKTIK